MSMLGYLLLHLEFRMVKLFQLAAAARCVTMATTETTERETIQEQHRATIFATVANSKAWSQRKMCLLITENEFTVKQVEQTQAR